MFTVRNILNIAKQLCAVIFTWISHNYIIVFYQGPRIICPAFVIITQDAKLLTIPLAIPATPPTYGSPTVTVTALGGKYHILLLDNICKAG